MDESGSPEHRRVRDVHRSFASEDKALDRLTDDYEQKLIRRRQALEEARRLRAEMSADGAATTTTTAAITAAAAAAATSPPHPSLSTSNPYTAALSPAAFSPSSSSADVLSAARAATVASLQQRLREALLAVESLSNSKVADMFAIDKLKDAIAEARRQCGEKEKHINVLGGKVRRQADTLQRAREALAAAEEQRAHLTQQVEEKKKQSTPSQQSAEGDDGDDESHWADAAKQLREEKQRILKEKDDFNIQVLRLRAEVQSLRDRVERARK